MANFNFFIVLFLAGLKGKNFFFAEVVKNLSNLKLRVNIFKCVELPKRKHLELKMMMH